jgi:membrane protein YdbS with pleckstrin-like domain
MKQKLINVWYFIQWMINRTSWLSLISSIVMVLAWTILLWPDPYGFYIAGFVALYVVGFFLYGIWKILQYKYEKYKLEQQAIFDKIKDSD